MKKQLLYKGWQIKLQKERECYTFSSTIQKADNFEQVTSGVMQEVAIATAKARIDYLEKSKRRK
jgi:hypothetical protein